MNISFENALNIIGALIVSLGGTSALIIGLATWLGKVWANRILEKDKTKYFKEIEELKHKYEFELEKYREELKRISLEHQVIFSSLHGKRIQIIEELYRKSIKARSALYYLKIICECGCEPPKFDEKKILEDIDDQQKAQKALNEFYQYFSDNKIYFNEKICSIIDIVWAMSHFQINKSSWIIMSTYDSNETLRKQALTEINSFDEKISILQYELVNEFRKILGVEI